MSVESVENPMWELSGEAREAYFRVENFQAVYADVERNWQDPERAAQYHRVARKVLHPITLFGPGVEDRMGQVFKNGGRGAIAITHGNFLDPVEIAAFAEEEEVFDPMQGITMIGAKVPIFMYPLLGKRAPDLGGYPLWRTPDVIDKKRQSPEEQERLLEWQKRAGRASIDLEVNGMNNYGKHLVKHVEGTRKAKPPEKQKHHLKIKRVYPGFGETMARVDQSIEVLMITAAIYYGRYRSLNKTWLNPTIYLDIPENQRRDDSEEVTRTIIPSLQESMYWAAALHRR
jgi:hypothetical protein